MKNLSNKTPQVTYAGEIMGGSVVRGVLGASLFRRGGVMDLTKEDIFSYQIKKGAPSFFWGSALEAKSYFCLDRNSIIGITKIGFRKIVILSKKDDRRKNRSSKGGEKNLPFSGGFVASHKNTIIPHCRLSSLKEINQRDRPREPKRNDPDSLPVINSGRK